ncbi:MAG TPA: FCD domain-containing protein [Candidatus Dormibacteraeota bacterium]|nr:FCD domain-containing protein [Candidatus Dormibacteraeota bacterium]
MADTPRSSADAPFHPIRGPKASAEVVEQITAAISSGRFQRGSRLPNIDALARTMEVSRPTVGDALRMLAEAGVIETRRGNSGGVMVTSSLIPPRLLGVARARVAHSLSALVEARRAVEMELAMLACRRATEDDFVEMERSIEMLKRSVGNPDVWVQANNLFHYAVGRAANSPLLAAFQHEVISEMTVLLDGWNAEYYSGADRVIGMHESTLAALRSRDLTRVREAMTDHLHDAETVAPSIDTRRRKRKTARSRAKEQGS